MLKAVAAVVASAAVMVTVGATVSDVTENFDTAAFPLPAASVSTFAASDTEISVPSAASHLSKYTNGVDPPPVASHVGVAHPVAVTSPTTKSVTSSVTVKVKMIAAVPVIADAAPFVRAPAESAAVIVTDGATMSDLITTAVPAALSLPALSVNLVTAIPTVMSVAEPSAAEFASQRRYQTLSVPVKIGLTQLVCVRSPTTRSAFGTGGSLRVNFHVTTDFLE